MIVHLNAEFKSLEDFNNALKQYCDSNSLKYLTTSSKTIKQTANKKYDLNTIIRFKYEYKRFKCNCCDAKLSIRLIKDGGIYFFRVISFDSQHNHEIKEVVSKRTSIKSKLEQLKKVVSETDEARLNGIENVILDLLSYLQQNRHFNVTFTFQQSQNGIFYMARVR